MNFAASFCSMPNCCASRRRKAVNDAEVMALRRGVLCGLRQRPTPTLPALSARDILTVAESLDEHGVFRKCAMTRSSICE